MLISKQGSIIEVDIHGMRTDEAMRQLEFVISRAGTQVREIVVIHGYSHGHALMDMVRTSLHHPRISCKLPSLNAGKTRILLK